MPNCKYCNTPLPENETGRRPREFCDNKQKCRNLWHRKNKKEKSITIPIDQWKDIQAKLAADKSGANGLIPAILAGGSASDYDFNNSVIPNEKPPELTIQVGKGWKEAVDQVTKNIPPMPVRNEGEDAFDFAQRKNEWKKLYQK